MTDPSVAGLKVCKEHPDARDRRHLIGAGETDRVINLSPFPRNYSGPSIPRGSCALPVH